MKEQELVCETPDGFTVVITVTDEEVYWSWWTPGGKTELGIASVAHEEMRGTLT